ncbi:S1C family serine protease [Nocardioides caeni]|uniref:PDZ domain-containing protein n=1 Tax=Nocardioides caeni TaxID=574700 RepID=A0A4V6T5U9_9ACTN|nr:trypsin-like peptidase domain-containing protein [Nocardioides caeni]THV10806.1 PDZ domain-containing protein [Nocardioides caeni]
MTQVLPPAAPPPAPPFPPFGPPTATHPSRRLRRGPFAALVLTGALVVGGAAGGGTAAIHDAVTDDGPSGSGSTSTLPVVDTGDAPAADGSVESVADTVLPSVVALQVSSGGAAGSGSGVVLDTDGLILTNDHVVTLGGEIDAGQAEITAKFTDGTRARATVVGTDPLTDTALVRVEDVDGLTPVTIGKSANLDVGEQVVAIGSPFGLDATVTSGIVSALDRPVKVASDAEGNLTAYPAIQTDAAINPGNSGGPLVDMSGHLVGINASIRSTTSAGSAESGSIGLGFAIPVDDVLPIIEQLKAGDAPTHARLGIQIEPVVASSGETSTGGARIAELERGSAAAEAGLEQDDVITGVDDHLIDDADGLVAIVRSYRPGDAVTVTYLRDGKEQSADLTLGSDA